MKNLRRILYSNLDRRYWYTDPSRTQMVQIQNYYYRGEDRILSALNFLQQCIEYDARTRHEKYQHTLLTSNPTIRGKNHQHLNLTSWQTSFWENKFHYLRWTIKTKFYPELSPISLTGQSATNVVLAEKVPTITSTVYVCKAMVLNQILNIEQTRYHNVTNLLLHTEPLMV